MAKILTEKYIVELSGASDVEELGREGWERKKLSEVSLKSPRMLFVLNNAFQDTVSRLGFEKDVRKGLSFDDIQKIKDKVLNEDLPDDIKKEIEIKYKDWKMKEKHLLVECRLSNIDDDLSYIERVKPVVISNLDEFIHEIKNAWVKALDNLKNEVIVQIIDLPSYDVSGFIYVDTNRGSIEINALYGLWYGIEKYRHYDVCIANYGNLELERYVVGEQNKMLVKNVKKLTEVPVSDEWRKSYKLSQALLKKLLSKSKSLSQILNRSLEISFGIEKNEIYIHDLKDLKVNIFSDDYNFSSDFFDNVNPDYFKNDIEAVSSLELPFFLREDLSTIKAGVEKSSEKGLFINRLKKNLKINLVSNEKSYKKVYSTQSLFHEDSKNLGFVIDFEVLLRSVNSLEERSSEKIFNVLKQSISSMHSLFNSVQGLDKEIILKLTKLGNNLEEDTNPHYFTKTLDLIPLRKVGFEILTFKNLIESGAAKNLSLSLPPLRSFEEMEFVLSILNLSEFNGIKDNSAKLYVDLSIPSMLFEYSKESIPGRFILDGVIVDLSEFMKNFFNKKVFTERDYKIAGEYLKQNVNSIKNKVDKIFLIIKESEGSGEIVSKIAPNLIVVDSGI